MISKTAQDALRRKAAQMLEKKFSEIQRVEETYQGATIFLRNGERRIIPTNFWIGETCPPHLKNGF